MNDSVFRQRLSSVMTDNMYDRHLKGRTRGKLDMRSLHKVATGSKNVFTQKLAKQGKKYNIVLLVDESGSMGRGGWGAYKIDKAVQACTYLTRTFEGLNVDTCIIGYNGQIKTHKEFGHTVDLVKLEKEMEDRANNSSIYGTSPQGRQHQALACNHDYDAIAEAYKKVYGLEGTSIVIALSDGRPNCDIPNSCGYEQDKHRFQRINALIHENERLAKTIGVGVLYKCEQFPTRIEIHDMNDLKNELSTLLKKEIKRK